MAKLVLLNIDANAKTIKGQKKGFMTAILYLQPYTASGVNLCGMAHIAGCADGCLNTAGRGGMAKASATFNSHGTILPDNTIQRCRARRTALFNHNRPEFIALFITEVRKFIVRAAKKDLIPVIRFNGTTDVLVEKLGLIQMFPGVQWYDYTKIAARFYRDLPANYHLSLSYSEASERYAKGCVRAYIETSASLVFVVRSKKLKEQLLAEYGDIGVDGDESDLRFRDPPNSLVFLTAKGRARKDTSGFVVDSLENFQRLLQAIQLDTIAA